MESMHSNWAVLKETRMQIATQTYPRLEDITKPNLTTEEAAYYTDRKT